MSRTLLYETEEGWEVEEGAGGWWAGCQLWGRIPWREGNVYLKRETNQKGTVGLLTTRKPCVTPPPPAPSRTLESPRGRRDEGFSMLLNSLGWLKRTCNLTQRKGGWAPGQLVQCSGQSLGSKYLFLLWVLIKGQKSRGLMCKERRSHMSTGIHNETLKASQERVSLGIWASGFTPNVIWWHAMRFQIVFLRRSTTAKASLPSSKEPWRLFSHLQPITSLSMQYSLGWP